MGRFWQEFVRGELGRGSAVAVALLSGLAGLALSWGLLRPLVRGLSSRDPEKIRAGRTRRVTLFLVVSVLALIPFLYLHATNAADPRAQNILYGTFKFMLLVFGLYAAVEVLLTLFADFLPQLGGRPPVTPIIKDLIRTGLIATIVFASAKAAWPSADIGTLVTTSAVFSLVLGLALQESLSNIFAGVMLSVDRPYKAGDWIEVEGKEGRVLDANWRSTRLLTRQDDVVTVPNSAMAKSILINFSAPTPLHRLDSEIGIEYAAPPNKVRSVLVGAMLQVEGILKEPAPDVFLVGFGDSAINYQIRYWIENYQQRDRITADLLRTVWYHLKRNAIGIPFPIRDVFLHRPKAERRPEEILRMLEKVDVLAPLKEEEKRLLADDLTLQLFGRGEVVCRQGDEGHTFFIIKSGAIAVHVKGADGVEAKVAELKPGQYFGEMSLLTGEPRTSTCIAQEDAELLCLDRESFGVLIKENPQVAQVMSEILAGRASETQKRLSEERDTILRRREKPDETITKSILAKMLSLFGFKR